MARLGIHLHTGRPGIGDKEMLDVLRVTGGEIARIDTAWHEFQDLPDISTMSATNILSLSDEDFENYLLARGYDLTIDGYGLHTHYLLLKNGLDLDALGLPKDDGTHIGIIYNFGSTPFNMRGEWPDFYQSNNTGLTKSEYPVNLEEVGDTIFDLILYSVKTASSEGFSTEQIKLFLENILGWEIFNEVNNTWGSYGPYGQNGIEGKPYFEYFDILNHTHLKINEAYQAIETVYGITLSENEQPPVIGPNLGGVYNPDFWSALKQYEAEGNILPVEHIALHPYGQTVQTWERGGEFAEQSLISGRILLPTDDYHSWKALTERDGTAGYELYDPNRTAGERDIEGFWDENAETGMERTMADFYQEGKNITVNFTEFGGASFKGFGKNTENVIFADPFKYERQKQDKALSQETAENLQAESVMQIVGLMEDWNFVENATVYEFHNQGSDYYQGEFGLHDTAGNVKPAGSLYQAYMTGAQQYYNGIGVDILVQAEGVSGSYIRSKRLQKEDELLLLRDGDDSVNGKAGDDLIFGGDGNDTLNGGRDYDKLYGGNGDDILNGGGGADSLKGGSGNDLLTGGKGADNFVFSVYGTNGGGYSGTDTITDFEAGTDIITLIGGYDLSTMQKMNFISQEGEDVRLIIGDNGAEILLQNTTVSTLTDSSFYILEPDDQAGTMGRDDLRGNERDNILTGLDGDDDITGGRGNDILTGGPGMDSFHFDALSDADIITDFTVGEDQLMFSGEALDMEDLEFLANDSGTLIHFSQNSILLENTTIPELDLNDFMFM